MNELRSRFTSYVKRRGRSLIIKAVLFVSLLLVLSFLGELLLLRYYDRKWDSVVEQKAAEDLDIAIQTFNGIQRETRRIATEVAQHPAVQACLSDAARDRTEAFEFVSRIAREYQVGVEVYANDGHLVAWEGRSEPPHLKEVQIALAGQLTSFVTRSQVFSQLFVVTPVRFQASVLGAVLIRRTTELSYPFNNKLIVSTGLADKLSRQLGVQVQFDFLPNASLRKDGRYSSAILLGIDSSKVGVVSVARASKGSYLESVSISFGSFNSILWAILAGIASILIGSRIQGIRSIFLRSLSVTVLIWGIRFLLLWLDLPSSVLQISVFDPKFFASKFGAGLAKSIGELFLTTTALFANTFIVGRYILNKARRAWPWWRPANHVITWILVPALSVLIFLLLRGYAATIRSAVYDSTIRYNDVMVIVPSLQLAAMMTSLFLLSFCLIVIVVVLTSFIHSLLRDSSPDKRSTSWLIIAILFIATVFLFEALPSDPLVPWFSRLTFAACVLIFTYSLHRQSVSSLRVAGPRSLLATFFFSAVFFYVILNADVHERDRSRVEGYAADVVRPADSWLTFVVDEALQKCATTETAAAITSGNDDDVDHLAFNKWAQSTAAKEGYSCIFALRDSTGYELSRFSIGGQASFDMSMTLPIERPEAKSISVESIGAGVNSLRVYSGSVPIKLEDGRVVGFAHVVVAAGQQTLFRGESPPVLRSESHEPFESLYRPITVAEFHDGQLITATSSMFPIGYRLPAVVQTQLSQPGSASRWFEERIDDKDYQTLYVRRPSAPNQIIALSVPHIGFVWHVIGMLKVLVYYAVVMFAFVIALLGVRRIRGFRYEFKFRDRLLGALLVTAIVPIVVMATYGRQIAKDRLMESTTKRLEKETSTLGVTVSQRLQGEEGIVQEALNKNVIDELVDEAGTDFNLYVGSQLQASSRPELYDVGILDKRMSGLAYSHTMLKGRRFYVQTENIGLYQYIVGYRPIASANGRIVGIIAVPTLYRLEEVEDEIARRNALIFGIYAVMLLLIAVIATTLANRIAAPVHKLTLATQRVARGDMEVTVGVKQADGEIGELIRSFEVMTRELSRNREQLVRAERELAWKEMAKQVAHEIKNPLTPMKLSMQHLRQTYRDKVANFEQIFDDVSRTIIEQIDTLSKIAGEFARFARMPKAHVESVDINAVLRESVLLFDQDKNVHFEMDLESNLLPVRSDREEIRRAFINIIRNGIQAMNNSGTMDILSRGEKEIAVVTLRDYGSGMSDEVKSKLFEPNFSTKTDGMGLGLAIAKKTIDDVGGTIIVESVEDKGTTVIISLPFDTSAENHIS